jgi:EpsG family
MWPYWLMFVVPSIGVLGSLRLETSRQHIAWYGLLGLVMLMIGLRFEVGGDWVNYLDHFYSMRYFSLSEVLSRGDPGYYVVNWIVYRSGGDILWVNLFCGFVVTTGVAVFSRRQPLPWLCLTVAVPYLIIVVAMGYSRQAAALGLVLVGLAALGDFQIKRFVFYTLLGALFHKSAILLLPIAALSATHNRFWTALWVGLVAATGAYLLVSDSAEQLWQNYVEADYQSQGGIIRVAMNAVPSVILLVFRRVLFYNEQEQRLWIWMAILSLVTVPLVFLSSTAVDRVALYFIPIQMFTFSRLPYLAKNARNFNLIIFAVLAYYALVQFVWLNYASHAYVWLPYQNYLFL